TFGACRTPGPAGTGASLRTTASVIAFPPLATLAAGPSPVSAISAPPGLVASCRGSPSRTFGPAAGRGVAGLAPDSMDTDRPQPILRRRPRPTPSRHG